MKWRHRGSSGTTPHIVFLIPQAYITDNEKLTNRSEIMPRSGW